MWAPPSWAHFIPIASKRAHVKALSFGGIVVLLYAFSVHAEKRLRKTQHHIWASGWSIRKGSSNRQRVFPTLPAFSSFSGSLTCHVDRVAKKLQRAHKPQAETSRLLDYVPPFLVEFIQEMTSIATVIRFEGQLCNVPEQLVEHGLCIRESYERSQY